MCVWFSNLQKQHFLYIILFALVQPPPSPSTATYPLLVLKHNVEHIVIVSWTSSFTNSDDDTHTPPDLILFVCKRESREICPNSIHTTVDSPRATFPQRARKRDRKITSFSHLLSQAVFNYHKEQKGRLCVCLSVCVCVERLYVVDSSKCESVPTNETHTRRTFSFLFTSALLPL